MSSAMLKRPSFEVTTLQSLVYRQSLMKFSRYLPLVRTSRFGCVKGRANSRVCSYPVVIIAHNNSYNAVESWELKAKLPPPPPSPLYHHQEVMVTSVNWESQDAAAATSHVLASYRWHGIMYVTYLSQEFIFLTLLSWLGAGM